MKREWAVIEFVGLPGSGKSTLSRRVAEILQGQGLRVEQPTYVVDHEMQTWERYLRKFWLVSTEVILHPLQAIGSVRAILGTRQASASDFVGVTTNWLFMSSLLRRAELREGVHIFDEGLINALWSIGFSASSGGTSRILGALAGQRMTPVVTVLIEADIATVKNRLVQRQNGQSRLERPVPPDGAWDRAQQALEQVKDTVRALAAAGAEVRVISVRNQGPEYLDADAERLAAQVKAILNSPG
jgi:thymidylate kinase